jgi:FkbM family methyltransferase
MTSNIFKKIQIFLEAIKVIKNWHMYPIVYFGLTKQKYVILETKNGLKIKLRVHSTDLIAFTHVWIIQEYSRPGFEINDNDTIIEIGAHIGLFSLFAWQYCKNGKIYCFEPVKENYDILLSNLQLNEIKNITPINSAVSKEESTVTIFINEDEAGHSMYSPTSKLLQARSTSLKKIFDDYKIEKCDFVKMDCEGAEYEIINSLPLDYFQKIKKIIIEYHFASTKPELLHNLTKKLESLSYKVSTKSLFKDIGFLYCTKITD